MLEYDVGLVTLSEVDADGFLGLQIDVPGEKKAGVAPGEMGAAYGMFSRPHDPELDAEGEPNPAKACGALYAYYGSRLHVWPQTDPRMQAKLPRVKKGGSCFYGGKLEQPSFVHIDGETGSIDVYVPYAFDGNGVAQKSMSATFDVRTVGAETIAIVHGEGMSLTMMNGGKKSAKLANAAGDAYVELNDEGGVLNGNWKVTGGMVVGNPIGALPVIVGPSGMAGIPSPVFKAATIP